MRWITMVWLLGAIGLAGDFVDAVALDRDRQKLTSATDYLAAHQDRYADLETRMAALSERCAGDPTVAAAFTGDGIAVAPVLARTAQAA